MKYSRPLIATLLMSGSLFQLTSSVLAAGTAATTPISNTATATYEDPTSPGTTIDATSNTVTVVVAEVAGVDVSASGITNLTTPGGAVTVGDRLSYGYTVTNIGNTPGKVHIPSKLAIDGPGTLTPDPTKPGSTGVEYSEDGGTTWKPVPVGGVDTEKVPVGGTVLVRAAIVVNTSGGATISVRLGNTPNNASNDPFNSTGNSDDVNTTGGNPANGQRESSATQSINVGAKVKNIALASVSTTRTGVDNKVPSTITDDVISYELGLKVEGSDVTNTGITPVPLAGTEINVDTKAENRILISNAIPAGTTLKEAATAQNGWTPVYSIEDPIAKTANVANWTTVAPTDLTTVKRVGFINTTPGAVVATGQTVNGFLFKVVTTGATGTNYTVNSMAQAFGSSADGSLPSVLKPLTIYDESGDTTPNNYDPAVALTPTTSTFTATSPNANGVADATYGIDTTNDNTFSSLAPVGLQGEINQYVYNYVAPAVISLLNGPKDNAPALGPDAGGVNTNNADFTNKSSAVPAGTAPTTSFDPAEVGFFNTIQNTGAAPADIALLPELLPGAANALPVGTTVRIHTGNSQSATYEVTPTGLKFVTGAGLSGGVAISDVNPIKIANVAPNAVADYQVEVNLPQDATTLPTKGFPVVINAFTGGTVAVVAGDVTVAVVNATGVATPITAQNKTIDRVYTGFIALLKETRILKGTGPDVAPGDISFSIAEKTPAPGNIIEYRITYTNTSEKQIGGGNSILNADKLVITEDGTTMTNKWAQDTDSNGTIDTSNVIGTALDAGGAVSLFKDATGQTGTADITGTTAASDVTRYVDKVTTVVGPGASGTFSFQRKVN